MNKMLVPLNIIKFRLLEYGNIMKGSLIANIQITKQVVMIKNHNDVHEIIFFLPLNHVLWALMFKNLQI